MFWTLIARQARILRKEFKDWTTIVSSCARRTAVNLDIVIPLMEREKRSIVGGKDPQ